MHIAQVRQGSKNSNNDADYQKMFVKKPFTSFVLCYIAQWHKCETQKMGGTHIFLYNCHGIPSNSCVMMTLQKGTKITFEECMFSFKTVFVIK